MPVNEHLFEFLRDPFGTDNDQLPRHFPNGFSSGWIECEVERCGKPDGAQHSKFVFPDTLMWITDGSNDARRQVGFSTDKIQNARLHRVVKHSINCKVASTSVFFRSTKGNTRWTSTILIWTFRAECGNFNMSRLARAQNDDHPETGSDR